MRIALRGRSRLFRLKRSMLPPRPASGKSSRVPVASALANRGRRPATTAGSGFTIPFPLLPRRTFVVRPPRLNLICGDAPVRSTKKLPLVTLRVMHPFRSLMLVRKRRARNSPRCVAHTPDALQTAFTKE